jgi:hypothetical protein
MISNLVHFFYNYQDKRRGKLVLMADDLRNSDQVRSISYEKKKGTNVMPFTFLPVM